MNAVTEIRPPSKPDLTAISRRIDETAKNAIELFKDADGFEQELKLAVVMGELRAMLTPEVMRPIMELMDTPLGFKTDRDPKKMKKGEEREPYSVAVVRDCFIESRLRGFRVIGNEWNIIAGGFYATKHGFRRRLTDGKTFPIFSNLRDTYDVPRMVGEKGAIVKCKATWQLNGAADSIDCEIPVKNNEFMGTDGLLGKAERKLLKRVHDRISGVNTPEGEPGEGTEGGTGTAINVSSTTVQDPKPASSAPATPAAASSAEPAKGPIAKAEHEQLEALVTGGGFTFDEFRAWAGRTGNLADVDSLASYEDIPPKVAERFLRSKPGLLRGLAEGRKEVAA